MLSLSEKSTDINAARWLGLNLLSALLAYLLGLAGMHLYGLAPGIAPVWPLSGVLVYLSLRSGYHSLVGQFVGLFVLIYGVMGTLTPAPPSLLLNSTLLTTGFVLAAYTGSRILTQLKISAPLLRCEDAYRFLAGSLICGLLGAMAALLWFAMGYHFALSIGDIFFIALLGHWMSCLLVLLPLLNFSASTPLAAARLNYVAAFLIAAISLLCWLGAVQEWPYRVLLTYAYFPVLAWIAWSQGARRAVMYVLLVTIFLLLGTTYDSSPFVRPWRIESLLMVDAWLIVAGIVALILGLDASEHGQDQKSSSRLQVRTWLTLLLGLAVTTMGWYSAGIDEDTRQLERFDRIVARTNGLITDRMLVYEGLLRGASGLFAASISVERDEWLAFIKKLEIEERFPGVEGFGFARRVGADELEGHEARLHKEGFPDYRVTPDGYRDEYFPIEYIEPFVGRNQATFGHDMYSESLRHAAMDQARDTGLAVMSSKLTLLKESSQLNKPGFIVAMPIYRNKVSHATLSDRRVHLVGFVYAPFRTEDLMNALLKQQFPLLNITLYDGTTATPEALMFSRNNASSHETPTFKRDIPIDLFSHQWLLQLTSTDAFDQGADRYKEIGVFSIGALASVFLFAAMRAVLATQERAQRLAAEMMVAFHGAEARYGAMAESALVGMVTLNEALAIESLNPAAEQIFGLPEAKATHRAITSLFQTHQTVIEARCHAIATGSNQVTDALELEVIKPDGTLTPVLVSIGSWIASTGRKFSLIVYDISSRVAAETALERNMAELARSNHDLDRFAYIASHDLRTPLRGMGQIVGWIEEDLAQPSAEVQAHLNLLRQRAGRLDRLLQDLLEYSRAGRLHGQPEAFSLQTLIDEARQQVPVPANFQITLECDEPKVFTLRPQLARVLNSLISNAVKHHQTDSGFIKITMRRDGAYWVFSVEDDGPGIPLEFQEKALTPFQTLKPRDEVEGSGIGLPLAVRIVERMGGQLSLASNGIKGTLITFTWPDRLDDEATS